MLVFKAWSLRVIRSRWTNGLCHRVVGVVQDERDERDERKEQEEFGKKSGR